MIRYLFISVLIFIISCSDKKQPVDISVIRDSINAISTNKKMVKIDSGSYQAFYGKDSGNIVRVKAFYLDETAVTNAEYLKFLKANPQWTRNNVLRLKADENYLKNWKSDFEIPEGVSPDAPVTNVSWFAAVAYAKSVGKRLPTVDEWEFAALADEHTANASLKPEFTAYILNSYQKKYKYKKPVKQNRPNYYGLYDMYGVVWEWTEDFSSVMMTGESRNDKSENEGLYCAAGALTSSDLRNYAAFMRFALRGSIQANYCINNLGFRCAKDID